MRKLLPIFLALFSTAFAALGQQYIAQTGSGGNSIPLGTGWTNYKGQFLYLPGELTSAPTGTITKVYFKTGTAGTTTYSNLTIKLLQNNTTTFTPTWITGLTTVYATTSEVVTHTNGGWIGFTLQTPMPFDATQSLIVELSSTGMSGTGTTLLTGSGSGNRRIYGNTNGSPGGADNSFYTFGVDIQTCPNPVFVAQPANKNICEATNTNFSVNATNASFYQWQVNTGSGFTNITNNAVYGGATTNTLSLTTTPIGYNNYQYRCRVTGACSNPVNTTSATLTLIPGAAITGQTIGDTSCSNAAASLAIQVAGTPTGYQWEMAVPTIGIYHNVPAQYPYSGTNTSVLAISPVQDTMNGYVFRAKVTSTCNTPLSNPIKIDVLVPPVVSEHPTDQTIAIGNFAQFTVGITGKEYAHYWQASSDGGNKFVNINNNAVYSGTQTDLLIVSNMPLGFNGYKFRCIIKSTNPYCGEYRDTSDAAELKILNPADVNTLANNKAGIKAYPNPVSGNELFIESVANTATTAKLYDVTGRVVAMQDVVFINNKATLNITNLAPALYLLQLYGKDGSLHYTTKIQRQ